MVEVCHGKIFCHGEASRFYHGSKCSLNVWTQGEAGPWVAQRPMEASPMVRDLAMGREICHGKILGTMGREATLGSKHLSHGSKRWSLGLPWLQLLDGLISVNKAQKDAKLSGQALLTQPINGALNFLRISHRKNPWKNP